MAEYIKNPTPEELRKAFLDINSCESVSSSGRWCMLWKGHPGYHYSPSDEGPGLYWKD